MAPLHNWELVEDTFNVWRMTVPGGWIYSVSDGNGSARLVFVPEPSSDTR